MCGQNYGIFRFCVFVFLRLIVSLCLLLSISLFLFLFSLPQLHDCYTLVFSSLFLLLLFFRVLASGFGLCSVLFVCFFSSSQLMVSYLLLCFIRCFQRNQGLIGKRKLKTEFREVCAMYRHFILFLFLPKFFSIYLPTSIFSFPFLVLLAKD